MNEPTLPTPAASAPAAPATLDTAAERLPRPGIGFLLLCALVGAFVGLAGVVVGFGLSTLVF